MSKNLLQILISLICLAQPMFGNPFISEDPISEDGYSEPTNYNFMPSPRLSSQRARPESIAPVSAPASVSEPVKTPQATQNPRLFSLLDRCQSLGPWLGIEGEKADNARSLYAKNCADIVEKVAVEQNLDVFFVGHGTWLLQTGRVQDAHIWFTMAYQNQPQDTTINVKLAQSFLALGQPEVALELLHFFRTSFPNQMDPKTNQLLTQVESLAQQGLQQAQAY